MQTTENVTFEVYRQGDRRKRPQPVTVRRMTRDEVMALQRGDHPRIILRNGRVGEVRISGEIKRWKTQPDRLEIPVMHGLYEHARFSLEEALRRFVVIVESDVLLAA